ncbi:HAD family hydrolase [Bacillota bacterium Meth-B3]
MIENLVLDMGNVLLDWNPRAFAAMAAPEPGDAPALYDALFGSPEWPLSDEGRISDAEILRLARSRVPDRLKAAVRRMHDEWPDWIEELPGAADFLKEASAAGLKLYLLSNAGARFPDCLSRFAFYARFSGAVVSAHERLLKPDKRIYEVLLTRYGLSPERCLFVDDMAVNVEGARAAGIEGAVFDGDYGRLKRALRALGAPL